MNIIVSAFNSILSVKIHFVHYDVLFLDLTSVVCYLPVSRNEREMAPNITNSPTGVLFEGETLEEIPGLNEPKKKIKKQIVWQNVIIFTYLHLGAIYGLYLALTSAKIVTTLFGE